MSDAATSLGEEDAALSVAGEGGGSAAAGEPAQAARRRIGKPRGVRALEMSKTCHTDHIGHVPRAGSRTIGMAGLSAGSVVSIARNEFSRLLTCGKTNRLTLYRVARRGIIDILVYQLQRAPSAMTMT